MQVCRICLATNLKLYKMQKNMKEMYEQTTGLSITTSDNMPQKLCWECTGRLASSTKLRRKALRSHQIMIELLQNKSNLTTKFIKTIDRDAYSLNSTLCRRRYSPNHSDMHLHDTSNDLTQNDCDESLLDYDLQLECKEENEPNALDSTIENSSPSSDVVLAKHKSKKEMGYKKVKKREKKQAPVKVDRRRKPVSEVLSADMFTIIELDSEQQVAELLKRRDSRNYRLSPHKCERCYKGFLHEEAYNTHALRHTTRAGVHACGVCGVHCRTRHALRNHAAAHAHQFRCTRCAYTTTRRHAAKLHEEFHNGTRYRCPHCQADFVKFSTYMSHIRIKHPSDLVCSRCGYSYVSAKGLALHTKLKHALDDSPIPPDGPMCEQCDIRFACEEALRRHLQVSARHNQRTDDPRKRVRQPRDASSKEDKARSAHSKPEGPIPCEQCDQQLPDSLAYYRHFRRSHPDKNRTNYPSMKSKSMCEVCGKMFQSLALLADHSWTHAEGARFSCSVCHKSFQRQYRLRAHARVHAAAAPRHACRACPKRFSTASNLQRHMVSHTGLKPFKCEMCGKGFKHASEKRVHITYVHLKKPWPKRSRGKRRDGKQSQPSQPAPTCASETDIVQPLWPAGCDPKIPDSFLHDKQMYYRDITDNRLS